MLLILLYFYSCIHFHAVLVVVMEYIWIIVVFFPSLNAAAAHAPPRRQGALRGGASDSEEPLSGPEEGQSAWRIYFSLHALLFIVLVRWRDITCHRCDAAGCLFRC